jgi:hypothetical protein
MARLPDLLSAMDRCLLGVHHKRAARVVHPIVRQSAMRRELERAVGRAAFTSRKFGIGEEAGAG